MILVAIRALGEYSCGAVTTDSSPTHGYIIPLMSISARPKSRAKYSQMLDTPRAARPINTQEGILDRNPYVCFPCLVWSRASLPVRERHG